MFNIARATGLGAIAALSLGFSAATSEAAVIYATSVDSYTQGTGITVPGRTNTANALGAPDGKFLSLGLGGSATFSFGQNFGSPGALFEITIGNRSTHVEKAEIWGIFGATMTLIGTVVNSSVQNVFTFSGLFNQLKIVDVSEQRPGRDGFDIDAVKVSAVPLPAGGLLLAGALGGIAALRRRKTA